MEHRHEKKPFWYYKEKYLQAADESFKQGGIENRRWSGRNSPAALWDGRRRRRKSLFRIEMKDTREKNRDHELNLKKSYFFKLRTTISNGELTNINFKRRTTHFESKTQAADRCYKMHYSLFAKYLLIVSHHLFYKISQRISSKIQSWEI